MTIQTKATEQFFPVVLFIMQFKVTVCNFLVENLSLDESVNIQMKATKQHFSVILFIMQK